MNKIEFLILTEKISDGTATGEEIRLYNAYYNSFQKASSAWDEELLGNQEEIGTALSAHIRAAVRKPHSIRKVIWPRIAAAASIILCLSISGYLLLRKPSAQQTVPISKNDITPGGNKAILTLANGRKVILNSATNGKIANQFGVAVTKTQSGLLTYTVISRPKISAPVKSTSYNIIETPRGGQYQVILPDGSRVWLNAASSIRFPAAFTAAERKVEITGEVYFEVVKNPERPFLVVSDNQTVEVLGTHFNVKAYSNDPSIITTLLEGSVKVSTKDNVQKVLAPGQRAILHAGSLMVEEANIEEAVAWKNGYFRFNDEKIESVMRQLSRWYSIEVAYEGPVSDEEFNGRVSRFKNISQVLKMLEQTKGVHFKVAERKVTVMQ